MDGWVVFKVDGEPPWLDEWMAKLEVLVHSRLGPAADPKPLESFFFPLKIVGDTTVRGHLP